MRVGLALRQGAVRLPPEGRIAVLGPPAGYDLSALPAERVEVIQGNRPDHDHFAALGYPTHVAAPGRFAAALVVLPRAKDSARALIAAARAASDGPVVVDGQKTDGVDSLLREIRRRAGVGEVVAKAHGKIFQVEGGDFVDWRAAPREVEGFRVPAGGFSAEGPDPGSEALVEALPRQLGAQVADLGSGWGYLARAVLERPEVAAAHLVEADHAALDCARANVTDPRAQFHWADARAFRPPAPLDAVVTNPPFHQGRRPDPTLGRAFIAAAGTMLAPSGQLWLVANRHLPYEDALRDAFREVREAGGGPRFKILHAARPRRPMRREAA